MTNQKEVTISIIIPIYNVERYLPMCLESIVQQSFGDFEVIVIDDGSTDGSGAIAEEFAKKDQRFSVIHQSNNGMALARNVGLDVARGQFIAFVDGDDWVHPEMLEYLLSTLVKTGADIAMSDFIKTEDSNYRFSEYKELPQPQVFDGYTAIKLLVENVRPIFSVVWNKLYDRNLIGNLRFSDIVSEDSFFNMSVYAKSSVVSYLQIPLVSYRQREDSVTHNVDFTYYIDKVESAFQGYGLVLRNSDSQLEEVFLWRWLRYALNRLNKARGTEFESYAKQKITSVMTEYWPDAERLLPWNKRILLKAMWKHEYFNSMVLGFHERLKSFRENNINSTITHH